MPTRLTSQDIEDLEIIDAEELLADGSSSYRDPVTVASTTAATKTVVLSGTPYILHLDNPAEAGDTVVLTGDAAGTYTVATVVDDSTFTVEEAIIDSVGGTATFRHPPGATRVGVDPTNISSSTATRLQQLLEDIDAAIAAGGITAAQHKALRQLIHFLGDGPGPGFGAGGPFFLEILPVGPFPTSEIWYENVTKAKKIVELLTTWSGAFISIEVWNVYDTDGSTILATATDVYTYSGVFEASRVRTIS